MAVTDNERPPYVRFERRAVEDRNATIAAGHYVAKDVDFAHITRPGDKDTLEIEASIWIAGLQKKAGEDLCPRAWADGFADAYKRWQAGEEVPLKGTPIKGWPVISPAAQESIIRVGILTVEDLAAVDDMTAGGIGTGGVSYKLKAAAWLKAAEDNGKSAETIAALQQKVTDLTATVEKLLAERKEPAKPLATIKG